MHHSQALARHYEIASSTLSSSFHDSVSNLLNIWLTPASLTMSQLTEVRLLWIRRHSSGTLHQRFDPSLTEDSLPIRYEVPRNTRTRQQNSDSSRSRLCLLLQQRPSPGSSCLVCISSLTTHFMSRALSPTTYRWDKAKGMHRPGIEPGASRIPAGALRLLWQRLILPLNHQCQS